MLVAKVLIAGTVDSAKLSWENSNIEKYYYSTSNTQDSPTTLVKDNFKTTLCLSVLSTREEWAETRAVTCISLEINV